MQLLEKIDDLIALARAESGSFDRAIVRFDFDTLLGEIAREANVIHHNGHRVGLVHSDPRIVSDALHVMLEHAADGSTLSAERDHGCVRITIESGALAHRIREDIDIGLAVVRARLRAIGGDVVASRDGRVDLLLRELS